MLLRLLLLAPLAAIAQANLPAEWQKQYDAWYWPAQMARPENVRWSDSGRLMAYAWKENGGLTDAQIKRARILLWRGHCSVHGRFTVDSVNEVRARIPGVKVLVHPECQHEVVSAADVIGSTESIIKTVAESSAGSKWAVGTELNLVRRLAANNPDKEIVFLDKTVCYCSTMNRIDLPHLVWVMESLVQGRLLNQITVDPKVAKYAKIALDQMLALP